MVTEGTSNSGLLVDTPLPVANEIDADGRTGLRVHALALVKVKFTHFTVAYPDSITVVYSLRNGSIIAAVVATVTLTYTDSSRADLASGGVTYP